ncbi:MAG: hypothetical protein WCI04_05320 [archaeon]
MLKPNLRAKVIQRKIVKRKYKSGNPVANFKISRIPGWRAYQLEVARLSAQNNMLSNANKQSLKIVRARAKGAVEAVYGKILPRKK